jgi:hypothetical protein
MGYLVTIVIVVVVGSILVAVKFVSHELRPAEPAKPRRLVQRRAARRVTEGDSCACGGMIGRSSKISKRFGALLGCTACRRLWTLDGRRLRRRQPAYAQAPGGAE